MKPTSARPFALLAALFTTAAVAHEFWIQPDTFRPAVGVAVPLRLLVGDGLPGERKARDAKKVERFDIIPPAKDAKPVPAEGKDGAEPAGTFTPDRPGVYAAVYRGRETLITLEPEKFESYLKEEGLDGIIKKRADLQESTRPGREAYSRCAKSLLCVGGDTAGAWEVKTGLTIEIVPASNPYVAHAGDTIGFTLLRDGAPLADAQLTALSMDSGKPTRATARTDAKGTARFTLQQPGMWVLNAVVMDRAPEGRTDVDWVSIWSSLSFDLAAAPAKDPAGHTVP